MTRARTKADLHRLAVEIRTPPRRRSNLGHEMAHLLLEHEFDRIL